MAKKIHYCSFCRFAPATDYVQSGRRQVWYCRSCLEVRFPAVPEHTDEASGAAPEGEPIATQMRFNDI